MPDASAPPPFAPERSAATAHLPDGAPTRPWRLLDRAILAGALVGLLVPGALLAAGITARPIENRPLATMPSLTVDGLADGSWFQGVDAYLEDNVAVRRIAVRIRGEAWLLTGGTGNRDVVRGLDGWLFARASFAPNCRNSGEGIAAALAAASAAFASADVTFRFVGIPDKHTVYPEQVGPHPFPPSCSLLGRDALRAGLAAIGPDGIDGWTILANARAATPDEPLYYRGDTHWTPFGALQVVRPLILSLDPAAWDESDVVFDGTRRREIDLAGQLGVVRVEHTTRVRLRPGVQPVRTTVPVDVELMNAPEIFTTMVGGDVPTVGGRTLILHDSYFRIDIDMLAPYFEHATWVHVGDMQRHPELATMLGPFDTVIVQRVERFLYGDNLAALFSRLP